MTLHRQHTDPSLIIEGQRTTYDLQLWSDDERPREITVRSHDGAEEININIDDVIPLCAAILTLATHP